MQVTNPYRLLTNTCRQLAENSEENNRLEEASNFRKMGFETERIERTAKLNEGWTEEFSTSEFFSKFWSKLQSAPFDFIHFLYRWLSGYGENWFRAFCWLIFIWIFFAIFYTTFGTFGAEGKDTISFWKSFGYSLQVMALQRPEPCPFDALTYFFLWTRNNLCAFAGSTFSFSN